MEYKAVHTIVFTLSFGQLLFYCQPRDVAYYRENIYQIVFAMQTLFSFCLVVFSQKVIRLKVNGHSLWTENTVYP